MTANTGKSGRPDVGGIGISNPQRVIDAQSGATKLQLAQYYLAVGDWLTPQLANRPLSIVRAPEGVGGERFFQRHCGRLKMPHMRVLDKALDPEHARLIQADSVTAVVEAVQMGTIEFHTWNARSDRIDRPDRLVFDLDPDPELPWSSMVEATSLTLDLLETLGLRAFLKTSGGRGMHVVVPIDRRQGWECANEFARGVTTRLATEAPDKIVAKMGPKNRVGKIFVDYLRNQRGASTVAAYSARARPGLPVSVPIARNELEQLAGADQWNILNLQARLQTLTEDPWSSYGAARQSLSARLLKMLDVGS
ncbi:non-homologous end-joining DNA ligase [Stutzerimonas stutzeri]|uniref:non-homologous end-joining DNA ligase n=1 Tax=Stutzerimonas stutzeri TaxID=316 RepID=UPI001C2E81D6|nr:non-homologous end-joining DNA ligase [Stutzerimonas stutzeri]